MTINRAALREQRDTTVRATALVIIATGIFFTACARPVRADDAASPAAHLTTPKLTTVVISGSSVFEPPRLFAAYREQLGKPISAELARAVSASLSQLYAADGYVKPEIRLDDSLTGRGVLGVSVFEAQVTNVVFEGDAGRHQRDLERIASKLEGVKPLRSDEVPQALRNMRAIAGLSVSATTRRDAEVRNGFELVVRTDFSPVDGVVRMNNRGTDQVGPNFLLGQLFVNGPFGGQEKLGLIFAAASDPEEYLGGGLYYDTALGAAGTRGNALLFRSHSAPNEAPLNFTDEYARARATLKFSHPLRQDAARALTLTGGFEADDLTIERAGAIIREDRLRIVETGLRTNGRAAFAVTYSGNLVVRKGLSDFGGGLQAADLLVDPRRADFLVTQLQASASRRFRERWSLRLDAFAQHTGYVLPDSERFKIGGDRLGRGFEVAEIAGDRGVGGKLELRRDLAYTESLVGRVSAYGFYDIGAAWKQDRPGRDSAATAGSGIAISGASLTGYLEVAAPLTGPDIEGKRRASVFAELSYRF
jgi:hemolysin activation/secretion protein